MNKGNGRPQGAKRPYTHGGGRRSLEAVEGFEVMDYLTALDLAKENGFEEDLTQLATVVADNVIILPTYMSELAVGCDCFASEDVTIEPGDVGIVPTGFKALFDGRREGLFPFIRSSIPRKKGLLLANGVGVVDADYYGNEDNDGNIGFMFYNVKQEPVTIKRFERIGQLVILPIGRFRNVYAVDNVRGESGSTGL